MTAANYHSENELSIAYNTPKKLDAVICRIKMAAWVRKVQYHRLAPAAPAGVASPATWDMPFRNLKRSLSVESTRVVFSEMIDL